MREFSVAPGTSAGRLDPAERPALVTGALSGIGRACAERLAQEVADEIGGEAMQAALSNYEVLDSINVEADVL